MKRLTATEAARRFAELLDDVESRGETFVIVRGERAVARIGPAGAGWGAAVKELLRSAPPDPAWAEDVGRMRDALRIENLRWDD